MSWPGAITSGLSTSPPPALSGPREEKSATYGAGASVLTVACSTVAVAPLVAA